MTRSITVAAAQCEIGTDLAQNRATLVRLIGEAAGRGADLVVTPEFGNHLSIYDSAEHAWEVAVDLDRSDPFIAAIGDVARDQQIWVVANATVRRSPAAGDTGATITVTQLLFDDHGDLVADADKLTLMGAERTYLSGGRTAAPPVATPFGPIGLYCCMDGVISERARGLATAGAVLMCNSLNSFALDEASLHVPVRAVENRVWVVACCKVGPLVPEHRIGEFASFVDLPVETFTGAGESQIVAPDGSVVARADRAGEAVITAEIDLSLAEDKCRADGTDLMAFRRPDLYAMIDADVAPMPPTGTGALAVAAVQGHCGDLDALAVEVARLAADGVELIVLPELAALHDGTVGSQPALAAEECDRLVRELVIALAGTTAHVALSVVEDTRDGYAHVGLVLSSAGVELHQPALHRPARHESWQAVLGDRQKVLALSFGRVAVIVGDDVLVPEVGRLAVLGGAEVIAAPMTVAERTDVDLVLPERAAENRLCLIAASRPTEVGGSSAFDPPADPVWSDPLRSEPFDGSINDPDRYLAAADDDALVVTLHPARTAEKLISSGTDLVFGRPLVPH